MSIAINTRRAAANTKATRTERASVRVAPSLEDQLRDMRALLRHFMLAFAAAATVIYVVVASGLAI